MAFAVVERLLCASKQPVTLGPGQAYRLTHFPGPSVRVTYGPPVRVRKTDTNKISLIAAAERPLRADTAEKVSSGFLLFQ
jgi:hypothetical protein